MNFAEYQKLARVTLNMGLNPAERASMTALGLTGESGEVADIVKKDLYHGHDIDKYALDKELGDVLWYLATLATTYGLNLEDIAQHNIDKLKARYPEGFSEYASINRKV